MPRDLLSDEPHDLLAERQIVSGETLQPVNPPVFKPFQRAYEMARPAVEGLAAGGGAVAGTALGPLFGTVIGGTLGYAMGAEAMNILGESLGVREPEPALSRAAGELKTGAEYAVGGEIAGPLAVGGAKLLGRAGTIVGGISGIGRQPLYKAFEGSREWAKYARKGGTAEELHARAIEGLEKVADKRSAIYRKRLNEIKELDKPLDAKAISKTAYAKMKDFGLEVGGGYRDAVTGEIIGGKIQPKGFSQLPDDEVKTIQKIMNDVDLLNRDPLLRTPEQLDILKRRLDSFWSPNKDSRAFVATVRDEVRKTLSKVPGYDKMVKDYEYVTNWLADIKKTTGLKDEATNVDRFFKNIMTITKTEPEHGMKVLREMNDVLGEDLLAAASGAISREWWPGGGFGRYAIASETAGILVLAHFNPKFIALWALASPRMQTEVANFIGKGYRVAGKAFPAATRIGMMPALMEPAQGPQAIMKGAFREYIYNPQKKELEEKR